MKERVMAQTISPQALQEILEDKVQFALIDVREPGEYNSTHIPDSSLIPRGHLEFQMSTAVPVQNAQVVVCDDDGRRATLAGATLEELGYQHVAVLEGGMVAWQQAGLPVEEGLSGVMRPPSDMVLSGPDRNFADMMHYLRWETALGEKYTTH
jgi:cysteine-S-conjugate beta-lyase